MSGADYLVDTNILIYHTQGVQEASDFINNLISLRSFNISILTKIEFLGWDRHTPTGFDKCKRLLDAAKVYAVDEIISETAIEFRGKAKMKIADAVIATTARAYSLKLVTKNTDDFKNIDGLTVINPFKRLSVE